MYAVSNRQISEAAGQGNNAAACYHFGTRTDLLRAIESKHRVPIEELRAQMLAGIGEFDRAAGLGGHAGAPAHRSPDRAGQPELVRAVRRAGHGRSRPIAMSSPRTHWRRRCWCRRSTASTAACPICQAGAFRADGDGPQPADAHLCRARRRAGRARAAVAVQLAGRGRRADRRDRRPVARAGPRERGRRYRTDRPRRPRTEEHDDRTSRPAPPISRSFR